MKTIKRCDFNNQVGFTLAEVLIAITLIGLVIVAGFTIYGFGLSYFKLGQDQTKTQQDLRRIAETISKEMRIAEEVEIFDQVPQAENGYTDIYFKDETVYIRRDTNIPLVLSDSESAQFIDGLFSNRENILVDFTLKSSLNKGEYSINSSVRPLNLNGDIMGLPSGKVARFKNPPLVPVLDFALFTSGNIEIKNGTILGNVVTDANGSGTVKVDWGGKIEGDLMLGAGADIETAFVYPAQSKKSAHVGEIMVQNSNLYFPMPVFPEIFPEPSNKQDSEFYTGDSGVKTLQNSGWYSAFNVKAPLLMIVGDEDIVIRTKKLILANPGHIVIERQGKGRVFFYVEEQIILGGGGSLNWYSDINQMTTESGDPFSVFIFYMGTNKLDLGNDAKLNATLFLKDQPFKVTGGASTIGNLITNTTDNIEISNEAKLNAGVLFIPHARLEISGGAELTGSVISKEIQMKGNAYLKFNPSSSDTLYELARFITFK